MTRGANGHDTPESYAVGSEGSLHNVRSGAHASPFETTAFAVSFSVRLSGIGAY